MVQLLHKEIQSSGWVHTTRLITEALSQQEAADISNEISGEIQKEEVVEAISNLRRHKAPGCDWVKIELIQSKQVKRPAGYASMHMQTTPCHKTGCAERSYVCIRKANLTPPLTTE